MLFISVTASTIIETLYSCSDHGVSLVLDMEEAMFKLFNVDESQANNYPENIPLEYKLFEVASTPDLLQGLLYVLPIYFEEKLFIRYICSGTYKSILPAIIKLLQDQFKVNERDTYPWELYTEMDIQLNNSRIGTPYNSSTTYKRKVGCENSYKSNKNCIFSILNKCKETTEETFTILFIHKARANPNNPTHRSVIFLSAL